ncbi:hypothetical protein [Natronolimnohabitans innermongolicus]|uniref:hypothetical protein n=1 Tax=Natronolimnohabitans innermongolicus TaxID=253107 RepID=UPI001268FF5C|nr:hypothetical protein [Natronolimnohabitans innermongolicus]
MRRRTLLAGLTATGTIAVAGCTGAEDGSDDSSTNGAGDSDGATTNGDENGGNGTDYDTIIDYTTHVQSSSGEYDLPDPRYDWDWLVIDFEVLEGTLDMEDVWFNGLAETEERYYTVAPVTDQAEYGIESRGSIREGHRGVMLHAYPPSPGSDVSGPMFSATDTAIGGDGVGTDGPSDLYPPVTLEYSVETAQNPSVLPDEYATADGDEWAVVTIDVVDGVLNLEDVWFRSQLTTASRLLDCDSYTRFADRGVRSRGLVKPGYSAVALYQVAEGDTVEEWGYTDDRRQDVTVSKA